MGGLGPGIGGLEILVIGLLALIVVGPKDLPVLMRKVGRALGKARAMANEFRASFDEMARQSELDELRKEVDALRRGQMVPLGAEAEETFRSINDDLNRPLDGSAPAPQPLLTGPEEFADPGPAAPSESTGPANPARVKRPAKAAAKRKPAASKAKAPAKANTPKPASAKPKATRKKAVDL
jgi:sec-independent protein translocase protein TatB